MLSKLIAASACLMLAACSTPRPIPVQRFIEPPASEWMQRLPSAETLPVKKTKPRRLYKHAAKLRRRYGTARSRLHNLQTYVRKVRKESRK